MRAPRTDRPSQALGISRAAHRARRLLDARIAGFRCESRSRCPCRCAGRSRVGSAGAPVKHAIAAAPRRPCAGSPRGRTASRRAPASTRRGGAPSSGSSCPWGAARPSTRCSASVSRGARAPRRSSSRGSRSRCGRIRVGARAAAQGGIAETTWVFSLITTLGHIVAPARYVAAALHEADRSGPRRRRQLLRDPGRRSRRVDAAPSRDQPAARAGLFHALPAVPPHRASPRPRPARPGRAVGVRVPFPRRGDRDRHDPRDPPRRLRLPVPRVPAHDRPDPIHRALQRSARRLTHGHPVRRHRRADLGAVLPRRRRLDNQVGAGPMPRAVLPDRARERRAGDGDVHDRLALRRRLRRHGGVVRGERPAVPRVGVRLLRAASDGGATAARSRDGLPSPTPRGGLSRHPAELLA